VTITYITARTPQEVAHEVDLKLRAGCRKVVLSELDGGGMLDQERLGAARYAAGLHVEVELEGEASLPVADAR
jgi:hypothetical protein